MEEMRDRCLKCSRYQVFALTLAAVPSFARRLETLPTMMLDALRVKIRDDGFGVSSLDSGAPRPMKMGTIASPWCYDGAASHMPWGADAGLRSELALRPWHHGRRLGGFRLACDFNVTEKLDRSLTARRPMRARLYQQETPVMFRCPVTSAGSADMAILGFGRRRPPEPGKHIVPPELWDDPENAAFFARIDAKPDDPSNLRVTHDDVVRMIEEGRKAVDARIHQLRANALAEGHDSLHLRALWLLHDNCWNGEAGDFLIYHLGLNPYDEWNTMLVAEDVRTASILDIPICTEEIVQHLAKTGQPIILALRDKLRAAHDEVQRTHEFGRFQDICDDTVAKLKRVAQMFGTGLVETYQAWLRKQADGRSTPR